MTGIFPLLRKGFQEGRLTKTIVSRAFHPSTKFPDGRAVNPFSKASDTKRYTPHHTPEQTAHRFSP
jgi:hypothetical protein